MKTRYHYNLSDQLTKIKDSKGNETEFTFDINDEMTSMKEWIGGQLYQTNYSYDKDDRQTSVKIEGNTEKQIEYFYDGLGRLQGRTVHLQSKAFDTTYTYKDGQTGQTTSQLQEVDNNGAKISYQYDVNGNITSIADNGKSISYEYDELNQLTRENNQVLNKTIIYAYDLGGNITTKAEYAYTTGTLGTPQKTIPYSYEDATWKDKLTSYDGKVITYDDIGNLLSYDGNHYAWEEGRNLTMIVGDQINATYKYNDEGIRTEKTVDGVTTTYHLVGDKVSYETNGTDTIYYSYDANNSLVAMKLNDDYYYYIRNGQGDITGILDSNGTQVVTYTYDTWGKLTSITGSLASTVGEKNPYRYRGYRYDAETRLYYLQSRYYNPEWGRFINADVILGEEGELLSHNMFAYCQNNPVIHKDDSGYWLDTALDAASLAYSIAKFIKRPTQANAKAIAIDVALLLIPGVSSMGIKAISKLSIVKKLTGKIRYMSKARTAKNIKRAIAGGICFTGDTIVKVENGDKQIKDIKVGDQVYSKDPKTGEKGLKKVKTVYVNETDKLVHIFVDGQEIKATEEHPFWVIDKGWLGAKNLQVGDKVLLNSEEEAVIKSIFIEQLNKTIKVYNFEVENWHTYYVSDSGVLVHNTCRIKNITKQESVVWKSFNNYKNGIKTTGKGSGKKYYDWDHTHNDIEVYDNKGRHLGSMNPITRKMYKPAVKGRKIKL